MTSRYLNYRRENEWIEQLEKVERQEELYEYNIAHPLDSHALQVYEKRKKIELERRNRKMERRELEKFDVTSYVGTKTEIHYAEVREGKYGKVLFLQTKPIPLQDGDSLPEGKELRASIMLGLQEDEDGNIYIGIGSKTDRWMESHKVDVSKLSENPQVGDEFKSLLGMKVVVQKNENGFLEIA